MKKGVKKGKSNDSFFSTSFSMFTPLLFAYFFVMKTQKGIRTLFFYLHWEGLSANKTVISVFLYLHACSVRFLLCLFLMLQKVPKLNCRAHSCWLGYCCSYQFSLHGWCFRPFPGYLHGFAVVFLLLLFLFSSFFCDLFLSSCFLSLPRSCPVLLL